ncbi:centrosomal protein of 162 kDa-like [Schistocerca nitens]|uniref:centrosomal protein of 162 kDa-like n=1 Tax=Schistocerca nitens TaxID=7011 RepID=UPI0021181283|nr:centrosomal protein of 162 kDa-like [Schistocerca nitens]
MSDFEEQFQAFLREPLSSEESSGAGPSTKEDVQPAQANRKIFWMKTRALEDVEGKDYSDGEREKQKAEQQEGDMSGDLVRPNIRLKVPGSEAAAGAEAAGARTTLQLNLDLLPHSPEASSSTADFVRKEQMFQERGGGGGEDEDGEDNVEAAEADGDETDEEISSILEEMSRLASSSGLSHEAGMEDRSVEEILKEAEEVVRESSQTFEQLAHASSRTSFKSLTSDSESCEVVPSDISSPSSHSASRSREHSKKVSQIPSSKNTFNEFRQPSVISSKSFMSDISSLSESNEKVDSRLKKTVSMPSDVHSSVSLGPTKVTGLPDRSDTEKYDALKRTTVSSSFGTSEKNLPVTALLHYDKFNSHAAGVNKSEDFRKEEPAITQEKSLIDTGQSATGKLSPQGKKIDRSVSFQSMSSHREKPGAKKWHKSNEKDSDKPSAKKSFGFHQNRNAGQSSSKSVVTSGAKRNSTAKSSESRDSTKEMREESIHKSITVSRVMPREKDVDPSAAGSRGKQLKRDSSASSVSDKIRQIVNDVVRTEVESAVSEVNTKVPGKGSESNASNGASSWRTEYIRGLERKYLSDVSEESTISQPSEQDKRPTQGAKVTDESLRKETLMLLTLEKQLQEEKEKCQRLQAELASGEKEHKKQLSAMTKQYEKEVLELKKEICVLRAKISGMEAAAPAPNSEQSVQRADVRVALMEEEMQRQEQIIVNYQRDNERLCQELKQLQDKLKTKEAGSAASKGPATGDVERRKLEDELREAREAAIAARVQMDALRAGKRDLESTVRDLRASLAETKSELERQRRRATYGTGGGAAAGGKPLRSPKSPTTATRTVRQNAQDSSRIEELERESRSLRRELALAQEEAKKVQAAAERERTEAALQRNALEASVGELSEALSKERARANAVERDSRNQAAQLQDMTRQVHELEHILKRNPVAAQEAGILPKGSPEFSPRVKHLENRLQQLEQQLNEKEQQHRAAIADAEKQRQELKSQYEEQVSDLELQLHTVKLRQQHGVSPASTAPAAPSAAAPASATSQAPTPTPTPTPTPAPAPTNPSKVLRPRSAPTTVDAHLLATVRGLQQELTAREAEARKLARELEEMRRVNRRLQKERERHLQQQQQHQQQQHVHTASKGEQRGDSQNCAASSSSSSSLRQRGGSGDQLDAMRRLEEENRVLHQEFAVLKADFEQLKVKRLQDLSVLQEHHTEELRKARDEGARYGTDAQVAELQGQLATQQLVIEHLQEKLKELDLCQEQIVVLKTERDHLENSVVELRKKMSVLQTDNDPDHMKLASLQSQLLTLEQRHEAREQRLQTVVASLLERNADQRRRLAGLHGDEDADALRRRLLEKNRQLAEYRAEMDHILAALRQFYQQHGDAPNFVSKS